MHHSYIMEHTKYITELQYYSVLFEKIGQSYGLLKHFIVVISPDDTVEEITNRVRKAFLNFTNMNFSKHIRFVCTGCSSESMYLLDTYKLGESS